MAHTSFMGVPAAGARNVLSGQGYGATKGSFIDAGGAAMNYYVAGGLAAGLIGCGVGAFLTVGAMAVACIAYGTAWTGAGAWTGASIGYHLGATGSEHADDFDWLGPVISPWGKY